MFTTLGKQALTVAAAVLLTIAAWSPRLDAPAVQQVDAGLERALKTFAGARALNAAISLAQGTEFTAGIGAQLTLSVGQILDPVNDLVEAFSNIMLMASVAFGIQKVLLLIGQYVYVKWALTVVLAIWTATYLLSKRRPRWLDMALLLMLMVRFTVPVVTVGSNAIYEHFLQQDYAVAEKALTDTTETVNASMKQISNVEPPPPTPLLPVPEANEPSLFERAGTWINDKLGDARNSARDLMQRVDPRPEFESLKQKASEATNHLINLIVVFLLQTVLVPLVLVWGLYTALRSALLGTGS